MVIQTTVVELERDGTLKLPADIRRQLRNQQQLSITRVGTSFVLAPIPAKWRQTTGRILKYQNGLIVRDPKIMFGTPVIAGTRVPVRTIVGYIQSGYSTAQVRNEFPFLTVEQIDAALKFSHKRVNRREH